MSIEPDLTPEPGRTGRAFTVAITIAVIAEMAVVALSLWLWSLWT